MNITPKEETVRIIEPVMEQGINYASNNTSPNLHISREWGRELEEYLGSAIEEDEIVQELISAFYRIFQSTLEEIFSGQISEESIFEYNRVLIDRFKFMADLLGYQFEDLARYLAGIWVGNDVRNLHLNYIGSLFMPFNI